MATRPALAGKAFRNRKLLRLPILSRKKKQDPRQDLRFFLPFMWETCLGVMVGAVIVAGGAGMVTVGYFADHLSTTNTTNGTHVLSSYTDSNKAYHLSNLTFVGPVFMGIGCFIIVVALVVVLETRDKIVKDILSSQTKPSSKKGDFYDLIIGKMKGPEDEEKAVSEGVVNKAFEPGNDLEAALTEIIPVKKTKRKYSTIEPVLKRIPLEIFAINIEHEPGRNSMLEIKVNSPGPRPHSLPALRDIDRPRRPTLEGIFQMESTPDPERRLLSSSQVDAEPDESLISRTPLPLGSLASHFEPPPPLEPLYTGEHEVISSNHELLTSPPRAAHSDVEAPPLTDTAVNEAGSRRSSVVVMIHEASLTLEDEVMSDSSLSSCREEQLVTCVFGSDSSPAELTPRPPRKEQRRKDQRRRKSAMLAMASENRNTLSAVQAAIDGTGNDGESSNSDDDSLHLTMDMMKHFDMSPAGTPDVSFPGTAEISFASATTANTLDTIDTRDTQDSRSLDLEVSCAGTAELSFNSVSTANMLDTSGISRPPTPEVPPGSTMNTRRRGVSSGISPNRVDV